MKCNLIDYLKIKSFNTYWDNYGGLKAVFTSPYFLISLIFSIIITIFNDTKKEWYNMPLDILPNLLGFSIGAYAVVLVLGNGDFWKFIALETKNNLFMKINGSFVHFIFIQVVTIIFSIICKSLSLEYTLIYFIGITLLIYAILTAFASTLAILEISKYYQHFLSKLRDSNTSSQEQQ